MHKNAINTINKYNLLSKGDKVVIALSGGADSLALLFFLLEIRNRYEIEIFALHVNHMIRGEEAERDSNFVTNYCENKNIDIVLYKKNVAQMSKELKISIEEAGRAARKEAYKDALIKFSANKIAVAHNRNDQAETFLLRLARGAGTKGLSCMQARSGSIIRPLLECGRDEIERYLAENDICFVTDSTNLTNVYDRNKVRNNLIPWIKDNLNPNIVNTLANTASIIREQADFLDKLASEGYLECLYKEEQNRVTLYIDSLLKYDMALVKLIMRIALEKVSENLKDITAAHISDIISLCQKDTGKKIIMPYSIACERQYEYIVIRKLSDVVEFSYKLELNKVVYIKEKGFFATLSENENFINGNLKILYTIMFKCDKIISNVYLRTRLPGDKIKLTGGTKKLKEYFIDRKVPREIRDSTYLIAVDNDVISVLGMVNGITYGKKKYYVSLWEDRHG